MILESLRIIHRPEQIEARIVPGHWEGDLIKGAFNRSSLGHCFATHCRQVGTLVERKTRFVVLCSSSVKKLIRGINFSAERTATEPRQLNDVAWLLNGRPRKTLGWRTPAEAMAEKIAAFSSTAALET